MEVIMFKRFIITIVCLLTCIPLHAMMEYRVKHAKKTEIHSATEIVTQRHTVSTIPQFMQSDQYNQTLARIAALVAKPIVQPERRQIFNVIDFNVSTIKDQGLRTFVKQGQSTVATIKGFQLIKCDYSYLHTHADLIKQFSEFDVFVQQNKELPVHEVEAIRTCFQENIAAHEQYLLEHAIKPVKEIVKARLAPGTTLQATQPAVGQAVSDIRQAARTVMQCGSCGTMPSLALCTPYCASPLAIAEVVAAEAGPYIQTAKELAPKVVPFVIGGLQALGMYLAGWQLKDPALPKIPSSEHVQQIDGDFVYEGHEISQAQFDQINAFVIDQMLAQDQARLQIPTVHKQTTVPSTERMTTAQAVGVAQEVVHAAYNQAQTIPSLQVRAFSEEILHPAQSTVAQQQTMSTISIDVLECAINQVHAMPSDLALVKGITTIYQPNHTYQRFELPAAYLDQFCNKGISERLIVDIQPMRAPVQPNPELALQREYGVAGQCNRDIALIQGLMHEYAQDLWPQKEYLSARECYHPLWRLQELKTFLDSYHRRFKDKYIYLPNDRNAQWKLGFELDVAGTLRDIKLFEQKIDAKIASQEQDLIRSMGTWAAQYHTRSLAEQLAQEQKFLKDLAIISDKFNLAAAECVELQNTINNAGKSWFGKVRESDQIRLYTLKTAILPIYYKEQDLYHAKLAYIDQHIHQILAEKDTTELCNHKAQLQQCLQQRGIERSWQQRLEQRLAAVDETITERVNDVVREYATEIQHLKEISAAPSTAHTSAQTHQAHQIAHEKEKIMPQADRAKDATAIGGAPGPEFKPPKDKKDKEKEAEEKVNLNDAEHILGKKNLAKHRLVDYLKSFDGNKVEAYKPLLTAAEKYVQEHGITEEETRPYKEFLANIKGFMVTIRVRIVDGIVKLPTAFIKEGNS